MFSHTGQQETQICDVWKKESKWEKHYDFTQLLPLWDIFCIVAKKGGVQAEYWGLAQLREKNWNSKRLRSLQFVGQTAREKEAT